MPALYAGGSDTHSRAGGPERCRQRMDSLRQLALRHAALAHARTHVVDGTEALNAPRCEWTKLGLNGGSEHSTVQCSTYDLPRTARRPHRNAQEQRHPGQIVQRNPETTSDAAGGAARLVVMKDDETDATIRGRAAEIRGRRTGRSAGTGNAGDADGAESARTTHAVQRALATVQAGLEHEKEPRAAVSSLKLEHWPSERAGE